MTYEDTAPRIDLTEPDEVSPTRKQWVTLALLGVVQFMIVIDNTIVNVALPSIRDSFAFSGSGLTWVVNAYALAACGLVMLSGRISDLLGRRRLFMAGTALFTAASLWCGLAWNQESLLIGRFAQGTGEALAAPAAFALVALAFPEGPARARAFGIWGGLAGIGSAFGVLASGILTDLAGWRWIFLINVLPGVVVLLFTRRLVAESRTPGKPGPLDFPSALLLVVAAGGVVQGLIAASEGSWTQTRVVLPSLIGVAGAVAFTVRQRVRSAPLVPLRFFGNRVRATGYLTMLFLLGSSAAVFFLLALLMQEVLGYSPIVNGLAWLPFCAAFMPGLMASFRLTGRHGYRTTLVVGLATSAVGVALLAVGASHGFLLGLLPGMLLTAFGFGMSNPALQQAVMHGVDETDAGLASGVSGTVSQLSGVLGLTVLVAVSLGMSHDGGGSAEFTADGYRIALLTAAGALALGSFLAHVFVPREKQS
ncbi:MFS transporter [Streptomyces sp. NPDC050392]|uniref:MFS transporter n=1 Tax=Streptomyces sp. NPDC050392 TaxID=3155782 RepID=UPI003443E618